MHGSPLLRALLVLAALLAMAVPLRRLTLAGQATPAPAAATPAAAATTHVRLEAAFAQRPARFQVTYLGKSIWSEEQPGGSNLTHDIELPATALPGLELGFKVDWPPGTGLTAARLTLASGDAEPVARTLWGEGRVDDTVSFP